MIDAGDVGHPRRDAGGEHHLVEVGQFLDVGAGVQAHLDAVLVEHPGEVADGLAELLLAGNPSGHVELAADHIARLEQRHLVAAFGGRHRGGQTRRPRADHRHPAGAARRGEHQVGLPARRAG